jgi:hypothetical protein
MKAYHRPKSARPRKEGARAQRERARILEAFESFAAGIPGTWGPALGTVRAQRAAHAKGNA